MHPVIADKQKELADICQRHEVLRLEIFGSAARGHDFDPETSDADFLVKFKPNTKSGPFNRYFDLLDALRDVLNRPIDLIEDGTIRNPYRLEAINRAREVIYGA